MDLINGVPRSPYRRFGNIVTIPRTIDKIRADLAGKLGEYYWRRGFSEWLLEFLGLHQDATRDAVANHPDDESIWEWIQEHMQPRSYEEIARFNRYIIELRPKPENSDKIRGFCRSIGKEEVADILTFCEWQDLEETRQAEYLSAPTDLSITPPRDPYEKFLGIVNLPRLLDKARAELAGTIGAYQWRTGQSLVLLEFLELSPEELFKALRLDQSDKSLCDWIRAHMAKRSDAEIAFFNLGAIQNPPATIERMQMHNRFLSEVGLDSLSPITTAFERLCWDDRLL